MPFRLFHVYETEITAHEARARLSERQAIRFANGADFTEGRDYTDAYREDLEAARFLPRRSR